MNPEMVALLKQMLPVALLALAWLAYIAWGVRWLRGVRRVRLF